METEQVKILAQDKEQLRSVLERIKSKGVQLKNVRIYRASDLDKMSLGSTHTLEEAGKKILYTSLLVGGLVMAIAVALHFYTNIAFINTKTFLYMSPFLGLVFGYATSIIAGAIYASSHEQEVEVSRDEIRQRKLVLGIEYDPSQKNLVREVIGSGKKILL